MLLLCRPEICSLVLLTMRPLTIAMRGSARRAAFEDARGQRRSVSHASSRALSLLQVRSVNQDVKYQEQPTGELNPLVANLSE